MPEGQNLDRCLALENAVVDEAPYTRDEQTTDARKALAAGARTNPRLSGEKCGDAS
jgi:hypothetical protein